MREVKRGGVATISSGRDLKEKKKEVETAGLRVQVNATDVVACFLGGDGETHSHVLIFTTLAQLSPQSSDKSQSVSQH